jgi:hypothetical protein
MPEMQIVSTETIQRRPKTARNPKGAGRKLGGHNQPGHHAGRPKGKLRKQLEEDTTQLRSSVWHSGRATIAVEQRHIDESLKASSSHCAIAEAIRDAIPWATYISIDLQSCRWTDSKRRIIYCFLTPHIAQELVINFDRGNLDKLVPITFSMRPCTITKSGARYARHTPDDDQLTDAKLKVADEQPHLPSASEEALAGNWKPKVSDLGTKGALISPPDQPELAEPKPKRKSRQPRQMISATKPDGSIPTTLGGALPPISILSNARGTRREFGLRQVRR